MELKEDLLRPALAENLSLLGNDTVPVVSGIRRTFEPLVIQLLGIYYEASWLEI